MRTNSVLAEELLPLHLLTRGQAAAIEELVGNPELVHRLEELGLRTGQVIEMVQPGSPCIVRIGPQRLCFRHSDAVGVFVRLNECDRNTWQSRTSNQAEY